MNFSNEILAYMVGGTISISEPIILQNRIGSPCACLSFQPPIEDRLPFSRKTPIRVKNFRGSHVSLIYGNCRVARRLSTRCTTSRQLTRRDNDRHGTVEDGYGRSRTRAVARFGF